MLIINQTTTPSSVKAATRLKAKPNALLRRTRYDALSKPIWQHLFQVVIAGLIAICAHPAVAQHVLDNTYLPNCRQNIANPAAGYECKLINPQDTPYKNNWTSKVYVYPNLVPVEAEQPEEMRNIQMAAANAE